MSIDEVKARIAEAVQSMESARRALQAVEEMAQDAHGVAAAALHDSRHIHVEQALVIAKSALHEIGLVQRRIGRSIDHADRYRAGL
jgi:hypothetical protein